MGVMRKRFVTGLVMIFILSVLSAGAFAFTLPDTGQTKCYDTVGTEIACSGTGQDGAYNINPMSYTDNGNGTITDNVTGLMWQKGEDATTYNWYQASGTYDATKNPSSQNVCGSLTLGGQSGWRLPTEKELMSLVDYSIPYPGPTINMTYFPNINVYNFPQYWSTATNATNTPSAYYVSFDSGEVWSSHNTSDRSSSRYARCVHSKQSSSSFKDNGNGTVSDNVTGLMWQQGEPGSMSWANALSYCDGLNLGGQSDWRLPNIKELETIIDDTNWSNIDTTYFPNAKWNGYWSSTSDSYFTGDAWYVYLAFGEIHRDFKQFSYYARCVRGGQSGSSTVSGTLPVYRFVSDHDHFFTISEGEKNSIMQNLPNYHYEGIAFYAYPAQLSGTSPVYRFASDHDHFFTISEGEKNSIMQNLPNYHYEGVAFYAYPSQ